MRLVVPHLELFALGSYPAAPNETFFAPSFFAAPIERRADLASQHADGLFGNSRHLEKRRGAACKSAARTFRLPTGDITRTGPVSPHARHIGNKQYCGQATLETSNLRQAT
jgi:hypothetical protein